MLLKSLPNINTLSITDYQRFWAKIRRTESCWLWTGARIRFNSNENNYYGSFGLKGSIYCAHRVAWFLEFKEDPNQELVLHECNISLCVRPDHLFLGNSSNNMKHRSECGRHPIGELVGRARLSEHQIPLIIARYNSGETQTMIAESLGVHPNTIQRIVNNDTWKHIAR